MASGIFSSYVTHGRYVETYTKTTADAVLQLGRADERTEAKRAGRLRRIVYVSRSLLVAVAAGDWLHVPEWLLVRFAADENPAYPTEVDRLTVNLYRTIETGMDSYLGSPAATKETARRRWLELQRVAAEVWR